MIVLLLPAIVSAQIPHSSTFDTRGAMQSNDGYMLGVNDEIEVTIYGQGPSQVVRTRIKEDGTITLPYIGAVTARGRTARQLGQDISAKLLSGGIFIKPSVSVDVTQYVSNAFTVAGEVNVPGVYPLDRPQTVAMAISKAGWARTDGADYVGLRRQGDAAEHRILFTEQDGEWSTATPVQAGDSLYVPVAPVVFVSGQVNAPGSFSIRTGTTLRQVLARAGGVTLAGTASRVSIFRDNKELKRAKLDSPVQPNDAIFVHERFL
jgi:polysaccharide export outer membrane protein